LLSLASRDYRSLRLPIRSDGQRPIEPLRGVRLAPGDSWVGRKSTHREHDGPRGTWHSRGRG